MFKQIALSEEHPCPNQGGCMGDGSPERADGPNENLVLSHAGGMGWIYGGIACSKDVRDYLNGEVVEWGICWCVSRFIVIRVARSRSVRGGGRAYKSVSDCYQR